ncbi:hypothetical protein OROGR_006663 [Orobanche gracilis]
MGVHSFVHDVKVKVSESRLFKALITESHQVLPKLSTIKSIEFVEGSTMAPGCVYNINFVEGAPFTYIKSSMDSIDYVNRSCKFTTIEGDILGDKFAKICHEMKVEAAGDRESVVKMKTEYHTDGGYEPTEMEINGAKAHAEVMYKMVEEYMLANPTVCA